jgi:hypothetical protein
VRSTVAPATTPSSIIILDSERSYPYKPKIHRSKKSKTHHKYKPIQKLEISKAGSINTKLFKNEEQKIKTPNFTKPL